MVAGGVTLAARREAVAGADLDAALPAGALRGRVVAGWRGLGMLIGSV
jgi:hypothetical protein